MHHDIIFLDSLLHDAILYRDKIKLRGKKLCLAIRRDCWELWGGEEKLQYAAARLTIAPVKQIVWRCEQDWGFPPYEEFCMSDFRLEYRGRTIDSPVHVLIQGWNWECAIALEDEEPKIRLQDLEEPQYYPDE